VADEAGVFPVPPREAERMAALREVEILDTPAEQIYDDIVALASAICRTPIAVVNFIDEDRQWGKALVGLGAWPSRTR
jgi:diguanylate cyclase